MFDPWPPLQLRQRLRLTEMVDLTEEIPEVRRLLRHTRGWLLLGGKGSGSRFHVDAYGCGAWSVTLCGSKRWALYPPEQRPPGVGKWFLWPF